MERAALLSQGDVVLPEHLPNRVRAGGAAAEVPGEVPRDPHRLEEVERQAILDALQRSRFNRTETAAALGISRRALLYKLQRLRELGHAVDPR
jgi:two-component system response regulator PilR (NtrC family)